MSFKQNQTDSAFANRMREAIGDESVVAFGRRCGLNKSTLRKYFYGTLPNIENIIAIADAANVNIEWLAAGRGPKLRGASASIPMIPEAIDTVATTPTLEGLQAWLLGAQRDALYSMNNSTGDAFGLHCDDFMQLTTAYQVFNRFVTLSRG